MAEGRERERECVCVSTAHAEMDRAKEGVVLKAKRGKNHERDGRATLMACCVCVCVCVCVHRVSPVARWWNLKRIIGPGSGTTLWAGGNAKDVSSRTDSTTTDERPVSTEVATFAASSPLTDRSADGNVDGSVSFTSSTNITDRISCFFGVLSSSFFLFDVHC